MFALERANSRKNQHLFEFTVVLVVLDTMVGDAVRREEVLVLVMVKFEGYAEAINLKTVYVSLLILLL